MGSWLGGYNCSTLNRKLYIAGHKNFMCFGDKSKNMIGTKGHVLLIFCIYLYLFCKIDSQSSSRHF